MKVKKRLADYALLMLFVAGAYWPLSSFHHTLRWDALEGYFPFRYFLSDSIRQGILPFWNPYQLGGYPFYGDPQSGFWYPFTWLLGSLAPYSLSLFSIAFLLHIVLAAWGSYELTRSFDVGRTAGLIAGISYAAGGFFVGNAEHVTWVISAAWLPWVFWAYHRMWQRAVPGYALLLALFLYLLLSGGYPAFFIIASYGLLLCFLCRLPLAFKRKAGLRQIGLHLLAILVLCGLSAGAILSWMQALPLSTRSQGMSLAQLNLYPFPPRALISLLTPFATLKDDVFFGTDRVMRNAYVGLLCLLALPFAWPAIRRKKELVFVGLMSLFALAVSFGDKLPLRAWLAGLPGMDRFRFPALFRVFFILGMIVLAAQGLQQLRKNFLTLRKFFVACVLGLMLVLAGLLAYSVTRHGGHWGWGILGSHFEQYQHHSSRDENLQLQAITQLILLSILLGFCLWKRARLFRPVLLVLFCVADMSLALSMNAFNTVVNEERAPNISARIASAPHQFTVPDLSLPIREYSDEKRNLGVLRTNTGIYFKTPQPDGYNSFLLKNFAQLDMSLLADSVRANPLAYFASGLCAAPVVLPIKDHRMAWVDASFRAQHALLHLPEKWHIEMLRFLPDDVLLRCSLSDSALLCLQQNRYPAWRLFVDGKPAQIVDVNRAQMGVLLPAGVHEVQWRFEPKGIRFMVYFTSIFGFLLLIAFLVFGRRLFDRNRLE